MMTINIIIIMKWVVNRGSEKKVMNLFFFLNWYLRYHLHHCCLFSSWIRSWAGEGGGARSIHCQYLRVGWGGSQAGNSGYSDRGLELYRNTKIEQRRTRVLNIPEQWKFSSRKVMFQRREKIHKSGDTNRTSNLFLFQLSLYHLRHQHPPPHCYQNLTGSSRGSLALFGSLWLDCFARLLKSPCLAHDSVAAALELCSE